MERFFSSKLVAVVAFFVIGACLTFSPSTYETSRGFLTGKGQLTREQRGIQRGSAHQPSKYLSSRSWTGAGISEA
jgi:hypothetical protein